MVQWHLIKKISKYSFWYRKSNIFRSENIYQVTTNDKPPTNEAGYGSLSYLTELKKVADESFREFEASINRKSKESL